MAANRMGITRMLITSNKTRFTSVHASMESVVRLQPALTELADKQPYLLTDKALALITDDMFFIKLKKLCYLLEPFTLVIHAVQSSDTTAADVMRYWLLLTKHISKLPSDSVDADFKAHCFTAYNLRHNELVSPLCQLALLLHPVYRPAVITGRMHWDELRETAGQLWQSRKHSKAECRQLMQVDLEQYKLGDAPYNRLPLNGQLATLRLWWRDPEKTFSLMGWFQSDRRSRMLNRTTTNLTMIKMHHSRPVDRAAKPFRALEDIMQEEQAAAAAGAQSEIGEQATQSDKGQPSEQAELGQDDLVQQIQSTIPSDSEPMDLASTKEVLDMFSEYYDDDCAQAREKVINSTSIETGLNFGSSVLDVGYVAQPSVPLHASTLGNSSESFDVRALL
ncbi:TPA: hypothetical protein ACH3X1_009238 [Trebouxia sp. C0004]